MADRSCALPWGLAIGATRKRDKVRRREARRVKGVLCCELCRIDAGDRIPGGSVNSAHAGRS
jgi:hypothetical protein